MRTAEQTRNAAFFQHRDSGKLGEQEQTILRFFHRPGNESRDFTLAEIADRLRMPVHTVSARCNALKNAGWLEESTPRKHAYSRVTVTPLRLPTGQQELFQ